MSEAGEQTAVVGLTLGGVLIVAGIGAYILSGFVSVTAFIPAIFGAAIAGLSLLGREEKRERTTIYAIGVLAILGVLGSARGVPDIVMLLTGGSVDSVVAPVAQGVMIVVCLILVLAVGRYILDTR